MTDTAAHHKGAVECFGFPFELDFRVVHLCVHLTDINSDLAHVAADIRLFCSK